MQLNLIFPEETNVIYYDLAKSNMIQPTKYDLTCLSLPNLIS